MKNRFFVLALSLLAIFSCEEKKGPGTITFDDTVLTLGSERGSVSFIVRSNMEWVLKENADWVSLNITKGAQGASVILSYPDNPSETDPRYTEIRGVTADGNAETVLKVVQMPAYPVVSLEYDNLPAASDAREYSVGLTTNIDAELQYSVAYEGNEEGWITDIALTSAALEFRLEKNTLPVNRKAVITVSGTDDFGRNASALLSVVQSLDMNPDAAVEKDFSYALALPAGAVSENVFVKGTVVADGRSENFPDGLYTVQNADGKAVAFSSAIDLGLTAGDRISLWLLGSVVEEHSVPAGTCRIFSSIGEQHIMDKESGAPVTPRKVCMGELTDDMLYSLVTLTDVEISIPFGAYVNYNEYYITGAGGAKYENLAQTYGTSIRDIDGNNLYMLTDFDVPYRRHSLPKGSGTVTGVIVSEEVSNLGDMGRYQIRHLSEQDIALSSSRSDGFTEVLVEWDFTMPSDIKDGQKHINPTIGPASVEFFKSNADGFYKVWDKGKNGKGQIYYGEEYRGDHPTNAAQTANTIKSAAAYSAYWDTGTYWLISNLSTEGITGLLSLQLESNSITNTGPRDFVVEWSLDGKSWNAVENGAYQVRGQANSSNMHANHIPGFKPYDFKLPAALCNQPDVYIRLRCSSTVSVGGKQGVPEVATNRLGHLSVKYNK